MKKTETEKAIRLYENARNGTLKLFKGTHNFIHYGEHLTPEEEERDMQNACRMHTIDRVIEEASS